MAAGVEGLAQSVIAGGAVSTINERTEATPAGAAIRVSGLWKRYGSIEAVRGVAFDVGAGEIFGLIGRPSRSPRSRRS